MTDLKAVFKTIGNHLAGNAIGATRNEALARQIISVVFCKLHDEKHERMATFRAGGSETDRDVADRVRLLYEKIKARHSAVGDFNSEISLDDGVVRYLASELQDCRFAESTQDVIAEAFEAFVGSELRGGQGQFFTPRNVVKLMVEIVNPQPGQSVMDPACGSGGFLVEAMNSMRRQQMAGAAINGIRGIEKDDFLSKVANAYLAIVGDGDSGVFCADSLDEPSRWGAEVCRGVRLGQFDVVLTNPPFGKDIKVVGQEKLAQYELASKWRKEGAVYEKTGKINAEMRPEILFIERSLQLLKPGGVMGIVLPETFFHAPKARFVMQFIEQCNIQWIIDLPHNTFRPHNNAKCVAIILQKSAKQAERISLAVAEEMGHDHQGKEIYRWDPVVQSVDPRRLWDDIQLIMEERRTRQSKHVFTASAEGMKSRQIFVPRYYWETRDKEVNEIARKKRLELASVKELIDDGAIECFDGHGSPPAVYKGRGEYPYIRVKDIVNWEIYKDPTSSLPEHIYRKMKGDGKNLQAGDILYVRRGSYRIGSVAMVSPYDLEVLLTREILVLRVKKGNECGLTPHYLLYLLSHRLVAMQSFSKVLIETTLPSIGDRWKELKLPLFADMGTMDATIAQVEDVVKAKWRAHEMLRLIKIQHGELVT